MAFRAVRGVAYGGVVAALLICEVPLFLMQSGPSTHNINIEQISPHKHINRWDLVCISPHENKNSLSALYRSGRDVTHDVATWIGTSQISEQGLLVNLLYSSLNSLNFIRPTKLDMHHVNTIRASFSKIQWALGISDGGDKGADSLADQS